MNATRVEIAPGLPDPPLFAAWRKREGWGEITEAQAYLALAGSQFGALARVDGAIIGFGRVVGDGALNFYVQDLIVDPDWRGRGVGARLLDALVERIEGAAGPGATIALFAAEGREGFYEARGFRRRPSPGYGPAMMRLLTGARH